MDWKSSPCLAHLEQVQQLRDSRMGQGMGRERAGHSPVRGRASRPGDVITSQRYRS